MSAFPSTPASELAATCRVFDALADPARVRILNLIRHGGEVCNCEIAPVTGFLASKISRHLALLRQAGLVSERREGTFIHYRLAEAGDPVRDAVLGLLDEIAASDPVLRDDRRQLDSQKVC